MLLDLLGLSPEVVLKMPLRKMWYLVPFDPRKLQVETKSGAKKSALLALIASQVGSPWLIRNHNRGLAPRTCQPALWLRLLPMLPLHRLLGLRRY